MYLRRFRIRLTLATALSALLLVGAGAVYLAAVLADRSQAEARVVATEQVADIAAQPDPAKAPDWLRENAWVVDAAGVTTPLGEVYVGAPVQDLAEQARDPDWGAGSALREVWSDDEHYFGAARLRPDGRVVVTATPLDDTDAEIVRQRWYVALVAVGVTALLTGLTWLLAGRMLAPAVRAQQFQRDFLADAAHELRTPIAVIRATASQALSRPREAEEYVRTLTEIRAATERAGESVVQLLDLARLDAGTVEPVRMPLRVDLLTEEIVATAAAGGAAVELTNARPAVVDGDDILLRQAIDNVVRNAIARATNVRVGIATYGKEVVVTVTDDGPGFDPAVLPHVFRRFARGHGQGHGLGLALVRSIVALHDGRAEAVNRPEGGAEVRLHLPLSDTGTA
ncbi:sensor histidine kinase [Nocardia sp. NPDC004278]